MRSRFAFRMLACAVGLIWPMATFAADLLPPELPVEQAIDTYIGQAHSAAGVTPAPQASDANLIRRTTLDLAGRIPSTAEARAFVENTASDKRLQLIERLLASPDYPLHQANEFELLLPAKSHQGEWREYLLRAMQESRPWDRMFREIMIGRDDDPSQKGSLAFLKSRAKDLDDLTNDTSKLFFGISINCAKCHDHPLVLDWTQDHYFGMASFFNRTYVNKRQQLGERDEGLVKFKTTEGTEKEARLMFLTGASVDEPPAPMRTEEEKKALREKEKKDDEQKDGPAPEAPPFSRRAQLVDLALRSEDNRFFSRSIVNRVWARMIGRGIVNPLDQMHSENAPSHPELLDWLARDLVTHGYDLKRLVRGIALSQVYARSSRWDGENRPDDKLFAVGFVRPLSPRQYSLSLFFASRSPDQFPLDVPAEEYAKRRQGWENHSHGFANQIEAPVENFQVSVNEALLFSNEQNVSNDFLATGGDRLVGKMKTIADRREMLQTAYWAVLSRPAEDEEIEALSKYLDARTDRADAALQQIVWALLTDGEARFNY
jgi:hypothetical protein